VLRVADLTLDPIRHRVKRCGRFVELNPREFRLLKLLLQHVGRALTRQEILTQVWEPGYSGAPTIVDVHVRHLRAKLDDAYARKLIHTVRGTGYVVR
jgi:DNA-binding response OmpR family regulator